MSGTNRRDWLRTLGAGVVVGLAGCGSSDDGGNGDDDDDSGGSDGSGGSGGGGGSGDDVEHGEKVREIEFLTYPPDEDPVQAEIAEMVADNWREIGLDVTLTARSFNSLVEKVLVEHDYDCWTIGWSGSPERLEPNFWLSGVFHSSQMEPGSYNFAQWENEEFDELAEQQRKIYDYDERKPIVDEAQALIASECPRLQTMSRNVAEPYNADVISGLEEMTGSGMKSFWNYLNMEVDRDDNTFIQGDGDALESLNPLMSQTTQNRNLHKLVYDRLLRVSSDLELVNWAAESHEQVDDTTIRVTIRDDMAFHDGEPVTAEDVKFSFDLQSEHGALTPAFLSELESTEVIDDLTVEFTLADPFAPFLWNGLGFVYILPEHIWSDLDEEDPSEFSNDEMIGSGPFTFVSHEQDEELIIEANPDHFNPPNIDRSILVFGPQNALYNQFEQGQIDAVTTETTWQADIINRLSELDFCEIFEVPTHGYQDITLQNQREPFDDRAFRRALNYCVPKQDIIDVLLDGRGYAPDSVITQANEPWHNPDVETFELDLDAARAELEDAGYTWDDDGKLHHPA